MSLGAFRPREIDFEYKPDSGSWDEKQQAVLNQPSLMFPKDGQLERIPFKFWYRYHCDERNCTGHRQSIIDWELAQAFRKWRESYRDEASLMEALRDKWLGEMWAPGRDSALFVGSMHQHPNSFLVLGVYWPEKERPTSQLKLPRPS